MTLTIFKIAMEYKHYSRKIDVNKKILFIKINVSDCKINNEFPYKTVDFYEKLDSHLKVTSLLPKRHL